MQHSPRFPRRFDFWWSTIGQDLYIQHGTFADCQDQFILQAQVSSIEGFAECILNHIDSFSQAGLSSATAILTIIPAGLALIPSGSLGVDESWDIGIVYFLLSVFAGRTGPGESAKLLAQNPSKGRLGTDLANCCQSKKLRVQGYLRWVLLALGVLLMAGAIAAATILGLQTILTWQADIWWYPLLWVLLRMWPGLVELMLLRVIRYCIQRDWISLHSRNTHTVSLLATAVQVLCITGNGLVIVFGTAVLGSLTLMNGATAIKYLFALPAIYTVLQLLLRAGSSREMDHSESAAVELLNAGRFNARADEARRRQTY